MRCKSCDRILSSYELGLKIELPDGSVVDEEFCRSCINQYVYRVDELDTHEHQYQHLTDARYKNFKNYEE